MGAPAGFPTRVAGEKPGSGNYHEWIEGREKLAAVYEKYDHPLRKRIGELATKMGGRGGMPVEFPEFTRGDWKTTAPLAVVS